jgi:hypothetical protein
MLFACRREEPTRWNVDVAAPLAFGNLSLEDLVADSLLYADPSGLWHLALNYSLTEFDVDSLVAIPDTSIEKIFEVPLVGGPYAIPPGQEIINQDENTALAVNNVQLKEVIAKGGSLEYAVKSYVNGELQCIYSLPGVSLNGVPVVIDVHTEPGNQFYPYELTGSIDLTGHRIDLTGGNGIGYNEIFSNLVVKVDPLAAGPAQVFGGDAIEILLTFKEPEVSYARGYFGQHTYDFGQSVSVGGDLHMPQGTLNLESAALNLRLTNAVGADAVVNFGTIRAINSAANDYVLLNNPEILAPVNLTRAFDTGNGIAMNSAEVLVNQNNSNLTNFLELLPDRLVFTGSIAINPLGNLTDGNDFIYTDRMLEAGIAIDIPLSLGMKDLVLSDTIALSGTADLVANGRLVCTVDNYFPFSVSLDCQLADEQGQVLHTLLSGVALPPAQITTDPLITLGAASNFEIPVTQALIDDFREGRSLILRATLSSGEDADIVRIYKPQHIAFFVKAYAETEIEVK